MDAENNIFNTISSTGPSRQLFETGEILFDKIETCSTSNSLLGIGCLKDGTSQLEEVCVIGDKKKKG